MHAPALDHEFEGLPAHRNGVVEVSCYPEYISPPGQHPSQPGSVVERPGQSLSLAQQGKAPPILSQCAQRVSQSEAEFDGQHPGAAGFMQVFECLEGLLEVLHSLPVGELAKGPDPCLPGVCQGLVPPLAVPGVIGEPVELVCHPVPGERLQGVDEAAMERPPPLLHEAPVRHLMGQGVLEGVRGGRNEARGIEELGRLQVAEATLQHILGQLSDGRQ